MALFDTKKSFLVPTVFAPSDVGIYAIYPPDDESYFSSYWDTCREQFAKKFVSTSLGFFLSVEPDYHYESVAKFINICEMLLEIKTKSKFYKTDMKNVIFINPSFFWKRCYMRRSLFSLLCRQGMFFEKESKFENYLYGDVPDVNVEKISHSYSFARKTKSAILRFFAGYHEYVGKGPENYYVFPEKHGWVHEFQDKKLSYIKEVLVNESSDLRYFYFGSNLLLD